MSLRLLLALSLSLLLFHRPATRFVSAFEDDEFGNIPEDEEVDYPDMGGGDDFGEPESDIPDGDDGDVISLTNDTLAEKVAKGKPFLLEFYAPWCGHCKALGPHFKAAAAALKEYDVSLAKMDATKYEASAMEYGVEGYPTILWVEGKSIKQFNGGRSSSEIVTWVKKRIGFAVLTLKSTEEAQSFLDSLPAIVAGYFEDLKGEEAAAFSKSGKEADDVEYVQTDDVAVAEALGLPTTTPAAVAVVKKEDEKFVTFDGAFSADAITQFAMSNRLPLFVTFSDSAAQLIFGGSIKKMVFLFFPQLEYAERMQSFGPIAREFKGKVIFIFVNGSDDDMENVREFFGVGADDRVALGFSTETREDGEKFQMEGELTADNLKAFVADFAAGKAKAFFKSEPAPEKNDGPVTVVVGDTFEDIVLDSTKDVLLEVYAPWCGHCKSLEPIYNKLGEKFKDIGSVVIAKLDGTANEHPDIKVEGFPTLLFYPAKDKTPVTVDAERKLSALAEFIKEHATFPFKLPDIKAEEDEAEAEASGEEEDVISEEELAEEEELAGTFKDEL